MARLIYTDRALSDLERLTDFLIETDPSAAEQTVTLITGAIDVLHDHPLMGRPVDHGYRELLISRGATGYTALYSIEDTNASVLILSIRHQREAGDPE